MPFFPTSSPKLGQILTSPLRRKLWQWEQENGSARIPINTPAMHSGPISNVVQDKSVDELDTSGATASTGVMDEQAALVGDTSLTIGTLVEMSLTGQQSSPTLAVCVGRVGPYSLLCNNKGQVALDLMPFSAFTYRDFVNPKVCKDFSDTIPRDILLTHRPRTFFDLPNATLTGLASPIVRALRHFAVQTDLIFRQNANVMDGLLELIAHPAKHTYRLLTSIAEDVYKDHYQKNGVYSPEALYNLHLNLISGDIHAQPLVAPSALYTNTHFYEIPPISSLRDIETVRRQVAQYMNTQRGLQQKTPGSEIQALAFRAGKYGQFHSFIMTAAKRIDAYRAGNEFFEGAPDLKDEHLVFVRVIEMWAGYEKFSSRSKLHMLGPMILRAIGRYQHIFNLSHSAGWQFLKEIGWIPRWEVRSRYRTLPPMVHPVPGGGFSRPTDDLDPKKSLTEDIWKGKRKKFDIPAFAIDSTSTEFIDDAISIEPGPENGQTWVHIHVADPTSRISASSSIAKHAEMLPLTVWMSLHHTAMLPYDWVGDLFSLDTNKVAITFSALLSEAGSILQTRVTPSVLGKVIYMTPHETNRAVSSQYNPNESGHRFMVGKMNIERKATRTLVLVEDLSKEELATLRQLDEVARKRRKLLLSRGAILGFPASRQVDGMFLKPNRLFEDGDNENDTWGGDPYIELRMTDSNQPSFDYSPLVHQSMLLGCETAASWCAERNIPIPYVSHQSVKKEKINEVVKKLQQTIYPTMVSGKKPSATEIMTMISMIGWQSIGTEPGRFIFHGQDMYAKVTSPLRRYSDMICHWQIHGWLQQQNIRSFHAESNMKDLIPCLEQEMALCKLDNLPFSKKDLDEVILPMLRVRERLIVQTTRNGNKEIALQALARAWKGEEINVSPLPETFRFEITYHSFAKKMIMGRLDWYEVEAVFGRDEIDGLVEGITPEEVQILLERNGQLKDQEDIIGTKKQDSNSEDANQNTVIEKAVSKREEIDTLVALRSEKIFGLKSLGSPLRFKDLEPGDVLEVQLKDVDVALGNVLVQPLRRVAFARRKDLPKAQRSIHYW